MAYDKIVTSKNLKTRKRRKLHAKGRERKRETKGNGNSIEATGARNCREERSRKPRGDLKAKEARSKG